jgi:hypothetical protein
LFPEQLLQLPSTKLYKKSAILSSHFFTHRAFSKLTIMADDSNKNDSANNNKQRKASKWRALKQKKKEQKRRQLDDGDSRKKKTKMNHWKKEYDEGSVLPHQGSFAHTEMQKLFNVEIGVASDVDVSTGGTDEKSAVEETKKGQETSKATAQALDKNPKRKLAFLVSFLGTNYSGFQINSLTRSIHAEIELGLYRAGLISKPNFGHPSKYSWSNSARTDKGVHAAAQVCSFKGEMIYHREIDDFKKQLEAMRKRVNECLPDDVRILGKSCDFIWRIYFAFGILVLTVR